MISLTEYRERRKEKSSRMKDVENAAVNNIFDFLFTKDQSKD